LRSGGRTGTAGVGRQRLRATLVIGETALALILLVSAGLFLRSLARIENVDPGFRPRGVMTANLALSPVQYNTPEKQIAFFRTLTEKLRAIPGATGAGIGLPLPFSGMGGSGSFQIEGRVIPPDDPGPHSDRRWITPDFFNVMKIPIRSGRVFTDRDRNDSEMVAVIDENLAGQYWPNENPVGKRVRNGSRGTWTTVVGVVGHVKYSDLAGDTGKGVCYYPILQRAMPFGSIVVRTAGDPGNLGPAIREAVRSIDPHQPVHTIRTLDGMVSASLAPRKFTLRMLEFFAITALFLAALGLYGVINYGVTQRTQEIGIRMALGAPRGKVLTLVVGQGLRLAGVGVALGVLAAMAAARALQAQLFEVSALDPATFVSTAAVLVFAATLASYVPARRATKIDPLEALRYE
jgi:putative ABC transport system permease protein